MTTNTKSQLTFDEALTKYLDFRTDLTDSSQELYQIFRNNHLKPFFGSKLLGEITKADLTEFIMQKQLQQRMNNGLPSNSTINKITGLLKRVFEYFQAHDYIASSPYNVLLHKLKTPKKEMRYFKDEMVVKMVINWVKAHYFDDLYYELMFALRTGVRRGEQFALTWGDVDFIENKISINKILTKNHRVVNRTKTLRSRRMVDMSEHLKSMLLELKGKTSYSKNSDFVFVDSQGNPKNAMSLIRNYYNKIFTVLNIPRVNWHGLRHTFASMALAQEAQIAYVSKMLGHSKISTTLDFYVHDTERVRQEGLKKLELMYI